MADQALMGDRAISESLEVEVAPTDLVQLVFASMLTPGLDADEVEVIAQGAVVANAERSVTGMLLYDHRSIFEVVEGRPDTVHALFATISADPRHRHLIKIIEQPIQHRMFDDWTYGRSDVRWVDLGHGGAGLNDFFLNGSSFVHLEPGRAKDLLLAFRRGRWHQGPEDG